MVVDKLVQTGYGYVNRNSSINLTIPSYINYIVIKGLSAPIDDIKIVKGCTTEIFYPGSNSTAMSTVSYNSNNTLKISSSDRSSDGAKLWFGGYQYLYAKEELCRKKY